MDTDEAVTGVDRDHIDPQTMALLGYDAAMLPSRPVEPYADMYRAASRAPEGVKEEYCVFAASTGFLAALTDAEIEGTLDADPGSPTFWWTRNDPEVTRFTWDGRDQRWTPLKGTRPRLLGEIEAEPDDPTALSPSPTRFSVGDVLPGDPLTPDGFALLRVGVSPDSAGTPLSVLVVSDGDAAGPTYPSAGAAYDAVLGVASGDLLLNPAFASANAGAPLWYNPEQFPTPDPGDAEAGLLGPVAGLPTGSTQGFPVLSPVPGPTERPFVRIGPRRYLTPIPVDDDASLDVPTAILSGTFQWSRTTGKIVLSATDIDRCTPGTAGYEIPYLGANLFYDGVALSTRPIPVRAPVAVENAAGDPVDGSPTTVPASGDLYVPRAVCLPPPGTSGVVWIPDGSGDVPDLTSTVPQTRPNGSGLVRDVVSPAGGDVFFSSTPEPGSGDTDLFAYEVTEVNEYETDLTGLAFKVSKTKAEVARLQESGGGDRSRVQINRRPVRGRTLFFRQSVVIPSVYAEEARILSRRIGPHTFAGDEIIRFAIDGTVYTWSAATALGAGDFTAQQVATDLAASSVPALPVGAVGVLRGRVFLAASDLGTGSVEIGWNADVDDLSGHHALGFLPGWRVDLSDPDDRFRWLPDNGAGVGVFRSPVNLDSTNAEVPDIRALGAVDGVVLTEDIAATPFFPVSPAPLVDLPGWSADSHFRTTVGLLPVDLENWTVTTGPVQVGVVYDFQNNRLIWSEEGSTDPTPLGYPTADLQFNDTGVFPQTVNSAAIPPDYGLYVKDPTSGSYTELTLGSDFLLPGDGQPGTALLVSVEGPQVGAGGAGTFAAGGTTFTDPNADTSGITDGDLLEILTGDAEGVYEVVSTGPVTVTPAFPASSGAGAVWRAYEAKPRSQVDTTLVADVQQVVTNHLPEEPFKIRVLTASGTVGGPDPIVVDPVDALASNRVVRVRFGLPPESDEAIPAYLVRGTRIGQIDPEGLRVPDLTDPHFTLSGGATAYFQIRVGTDPFNTTLGNLTLDTGPPAPGSGLVDVDTTTGDITVDPDLASSEAGTTVSYDQLFLDPSDLAAGQCEIRASDGQVNLSAADAAAHSGTTAYFVEQMVTEGNLDVRTSPVNGSILFQKPLRAGQIVEVNYFRADTNGDKVIDPETGNPVEITEFLPLIVRLEEATVVPGTGGSQFVFNPTGRTLAPQVDPFVWVGVDLQNFAGRRTASVDFTTGVITLKTTSDPGQTVKINYAVLEAFGGEQAYTVSSPPVFRKPFFLEQGQDTFTMDTDRSADFPTGHLMLVGPVPLYVDTVSYDAGTDQTEITVFPTPLSEVGSRAVGQDASLTVSDKAVSVSRGGAAGFMPLLDTDPASPTGTPLLPVDRGQLQVSFYGDVQEFMRPNHLLEIEGYPYLVVGSTLSDDGTATVVDIATPAYKEHPAGNTPVRVSLRPVYGPSPTTFNGLGAFLDTEPFDAFLLGRTDESGAAIPGIRLIEGIDYTADPATGQITLQSPSQRGLAPGERLHFRYTQINPLGPTVIDGAVLYPLFKAKYLRVTTPSEENRLKGSPLLGKFSYRSPDTFYYSVLPLTTYLAEVAEVSAAKGASGPSGGPTFSVPGSGDSSDQGRLGIRGEVLDLRDQDNAARSFIEQFNGIVLAFEQILEAIDGRIIGDRDGKFRFFIGHGKRYAPPGWEDEITGDLVARLIWREIIAEWAPEEFIDALGWYTEDDPVFNPVTATSPDPVSRPGDADGLTPNPRTLEFFTDRQRRLILNDMDDRLLIGFGRPRGFAALFPQIDIPGLFKSMWEAHRFSRLFPERAKHFSRLLPGLEAAFNNAGQVTDAGFYSPGRVTTVPGPEPGEETQETVRTFNTAIGVVANAALGKIENVVDTTVSDRPPRARVWAYYPNGNADLDTALGTSTAGNPTIVATPLTLGQFPVDPATGFPDASQLLSEGGDLSDLVSGDGVLTTPGFAVDQTLQYGTPEGTIYTLLSSGGDPITVATVEAGCVLTLSDTPEVNGEPLEDVITSGDGTGFGDTVYVIPEIPASFPSSGSNADGDEIAAFAEAIPGYRIQFDLKVARRTGEFLDNTLWTTDDVFPLPVQKFLGQKPPDPLSCVEGLVEFVNTDREPARLPALLGQDKDDSGDYQIPYLTGTDTELTLLGQVADGLPSGLFIDSTVALPYSPAPGAEPQTWGAVYPDETFVSDGEILLSASFPRDPATLYTTTGSFQPVSGPYTANSGLGNVRPFDLLLVETDQPDLYGAMTGILTVGSASDTSVETPRFVTPAALGNTHRYTLRGWAANVEDRTGDPGFTASSSALGPPNQFRTVFNFASVTGINLNPAAAFITGNNVVVIRAYEANPLFVGDPFVGAFIITSGSVFAYNHGTTTTTEVPYVGPPVFNATSIQLGYDSSPSPLDIIALAGLSSGTAYDFSLDVDTYVDPETSAFSGGPLPVGFGTGSTTCQISRDRLTFIEELAMNLAKPRDYLPANGDASYELGIQLAVHEVEINGTTGLTVNAPAEVNGGSYFTLLERFGPSPDGSVPSGVSYVGTWDPGSGTGRIRMMAWEGHGNTPLSGAVSNIQISGVPSSDLGDTAPVLEARGQILDGDSDLAPVPLGGSSVLVGNRNYIIGSPALLVDSGALSNVVPGDVVVVDSSSLSATEGAVKAGTYLVRHAVDQWSGAKTTDAASFYGLGVPVTEARQSAASGSPFPAAEAPLQSGSATLLPPGGTGTGALDLSFPIITGLDTGAGEVTLSGVRPVPGSPTGHGWASSGRVYLVRRDAYCRFDEDAGGTGVPGWIVDAEAIVSMAYTSVVSYTPEYASAPSGEGASGGALVLTLQSGTALRADGTALTDNQFYGLARIGTRVSGMAYVAIEQMGDHLPKNNVVGPDLLATGEELLAGFQRITVRNQNQSILVPAIAGGVTPAAVSRDTIVKTLVNSFLGTPDPDDLIVGIPVPKDNTDWYPDRREAVYGTMYDSTDDENGVVAGVATYLDLTAWTDSGAWYGAHYGGATAFNESAAPIVPTTACLLPGDRFTFGSDIDPNAGVAGFYALTGVFLEPSFPRPTLDLGAAAPRVVTDTLSGSLTTDDIGIRDRDDFDSGTLGTEAVRFFVRRIRRFHEVPNGIIGLLQRLRYAYEIRRGLVGSTTGRTFVADTSLYGAATNLGAFDVPEVNINAGDEIRVLDPATGTVIDTAEVERVIGPTILRLRRPGITATVPAGATFEVYLRTAIVPHEQSNEQLLDLLTKETLYTRKVDYGAGDTAGGRAPNANELEDPAITDWLNDAGVQEGDYVVVDPAGPLYVGSEAGVRPVGDQAVFGRAPYIAGAPSPLDDNRGFYKVTGSTSGATLTVDGASRFSDGTFGDGGAEYVVLPDVGNGTEGQQDLRATAPPIPAGGSYLDPGRDATKSIEPFAFRVIRPNEVFSEDATELVLFLRERMLSWIEKINRISGNQSGDYFVFQRDDHIAFLSRTNGLGVLSNADVESLIGLTGSTPFANVSDCLSVLDRRFWILDFRLDALGYSTFNTNADGQRPVLPDLVEAVLDLEDQFREQRYSWIAFRADRVDGTLQEARRAEDTLPERITKSRMALARKKNLDGG